MKLLAYKTLCWFFGPTCVEKSQLLLCVNLLNPRLSALQNALWHEPQVGVKWNLKAATSHAE